MTPYVAFLDRVAELSNFTIQPLRQLRIHPDDFDALRADKRAAQNLVITPLGDTVINNVRLIVDKNANRLDISK